MTPEAKRKQININTWSCHKAREFYYHAVSKFRAEAATSAVAHSPWLHPRGNWRGKGWGAIWGGPSLQGLVWPPGEFL